MKFKHTDMVFCTEILESPLYSPVLFHYFIPVNTHLHGSYCMVRPRPVLRAHKREASGGVFGTINSPKVTLKGCEKGPE